jgi:glycosyltransferase involved in cell wall biosynthesis
MKILFTSEFYYPHIGGAEEVVRRIAEGMHKKGHEVTVATSFLKERNFDVLNGVKIVEFKISGNKVKGLKGNLEEYVNFLKNSSFDLVCNYAAQSWTTDLALDILDEINGKKILFPCGYSGLTSFLRKVLYWNYFRKLPSYLKKYDHIIYHSQNYIDKHFGDRHGILNYSVIPNGVDLEEMKLNNINFREKYGIKTKFMILNVSNHYKIKGHSFLFKMYKILARPDVSLIIIGNKVKGYNSCYNECKKNSLIMENIFILENIPREDIISAYHQADIFVLSSKIEVFPLVILEAASVGLPFISTNVGNVKELKGGIIVSSPEEMAINIDKLLDNPEYRIKLGLEGKKQVLERYTWENILQQYECVFNMVMEGRS